MRESRNNRTAKIGRGLPTAAREGGIRLQGGDSGQSINSSGVSRETIDEKRVGGCISIGVIKIEVIEVVQLK